MPRRASTLIVKAVPIGAVFSTTIMPSFSSSRRSPSIGTHIRPRACVTMKLTASGVILSAAMTRSPSFSRSSSSTTTRMRPCRISSIASSMVAKPLIMPPSPRATAARTCRSRPSRRQPAERRDRQRVRDQHHLEGGLVERRHRQAHAVHGHRALRDQQRRQPPVADDYPDPCGRFYTRYGFYCARAVHVSEDEVTTERAAETQWALEVDGAPGPKRAERCARQRLRPHLERESFGRHLDHGETYAAHRDARANLAALARHARGDIQPRDVALACDGAYGADLFDDSREHGYVDSTRSTSASMRRSSPMGRAVIPASLTADFSSRPAPATTVGAVRPPSSSGATNSVTRSTNPASRNAACTSPPPSTSAARTSRSNSAARTASMATRPSRSG